MTERITIQHGNDTIVGYRQANGQIRCGLCSKISRFENVYALRRHCGTVHNMSAIESRVCEHCDDTFQTDHTADQEYCSIECSNEDSTYSHEKRLCRFCGSFLSNDEEEHCDDCTQMAAIADGGVHSD